MLQTAGGGKDLVVGVTLMGFRKGQMMHCDAGKRFPSRVLGRVKPSIWCKLIRPSGNQIGSETENAYGVHSIMVFQTQSILGMVDRFLLPCLDGGIDSGNEDGYS